MDSVLNCMVSDNLAPGEYVDRFLKVVKERLGYDYSVALRNPIVALNLAFEALGLAPGDSVGLSALSSAWAFKCLDARGLKPIWLDADIGSGCIEASSVERLAGGGAKVLYLAEPWGILPDPAMLLEIGLPVIEDVTTSLGAVSGESKAGSLGIFSLMGLEHAASFTAGGGALLSASSKRDAQVLRNASEHLVPEELLADMNAALAFSQLKDLEKFLEKRKGLHELYSQSLARSRKRALSQSAEGESAYFGYVVVLESGVKDVRAYARKKGVQTVMAFDGTCITAGFVPGDLCQHAASLANRAVAFPLHPRIGASAAQKVAKVLATLP